MNIETITICTRCPTNDKITNFVYERNDGHIHMFKCQDCGEIYSLSILQRIRNDEYIQQIKEELKHDTAK
jgi:uncharacterized Zn finger protein